MNGSHFSLILLPTLACNADCDYCFENKTEQRLTLEQLELILQKVMDFLDNEHIGRLSLYWQGGEVMTLPPEWLEQADLIIRRSAEARQREVVNYLQSNMIGYSGKWNRILRDMFNGSVGSSMDFPNIHRRLAAGGPEAYEALWAQNVRAAREAGIRVSVIALPSEKTLELGAARFYEHFVDELGITEFQVNTPFPGGAANRVKDGYPLDCEALAGFLLDLDSVRARRDADRRVTIGPLDRILDYFETGRKDLLCIWQDNCANRFVCIDPQGHVSQCDCWAASYPEFRFGNIFDGTDLSTLLRTSAARGRLRERPGMLVQRGDCIDCRYLGICHGGCPVRAYTVQGDLGRKDPYCRFYRKLFEGMELFAASEARRIGKLSC